MKKFLLTLVLLVGMVFGAFAQKLTYQAVVRDNNQQLVTNTAVKATVTIDFTGDQADYDTTITDVSTNLHGLLSIEFGGKTLNGRDWTGATIAVKVVNKNDESIVYVNGDARPVSAVPYALSVNGQSIQNYLTEHHYVDLDKLNDTLGAYSTTAAMDGRHYLTSDSTVITTMQGNITANANNIANLTLHTAKAAIRDSVAGQIHDSISNIAAKAHTHDNMAILNATEAPYTDADSAKLHDIAEGAEVNVQSDWKQTDGSKDDYIKNKPSITDTVNNILTTDGYVTASALDNRHYLTSDSAVIITMQDDIATNKTNISKNANNINNLILHTAKAAIRDSVAGQIHDSISNIAAKAHTHDNMAILNATEAPYTKADSLKLHDIAAGAQKNVQSDWKQGTTTADDYIKNKPSITDTVNNILTTGKYVTETTLDARHYLTSDSAVITTMQGNITTNTTNIATNAADIAALANRVNTFNTNVCDSVKDCDFSDNISIKNMLQQLTARLDAQNAKIDSLAHMVDSLSSLPHGGGETPETPDTPGGGEPTIVDTVTCYPNLGANGSVKKTVTRGQNIDLSTVSFSHPVETNWEIASWNTSADGTGTSYSNTLTTTGNLTLYAQWRTFCTGTPSDNEVGNARIDSLKDVDNNKYAVVQIGNQCWMKENMKTTQYANGGAIADDKMFNPGNSADNVAIYGKLYTWSAATRDSSTTYPADGQMKVQGICPAGWHVPSDAEFDTLTNYVKGKSEYICSEGADNIANALADTTGWSNYTSSGCNAGNTGDKANLTGFSALPAGYYYNSCNLFGNLANFWSATEFSKNYAYNRDLFYTNDTVYSGNYSKDYGFSVRCVRDVRIVDIVFCYPNLGANTPDTNTVTRGQNFDLSTVSFTHPVETNWEIASWNTSADGSGTRYEKDATITTSGNLTLYAQWRTYCTGMPSDNEVGNARIDSLIDVDNNKYAVVQIGSQCWMKQNLRTNVGDSGYPKKNYGLDELSEDEKVTYGRLYTWTAMMNDKNSSNDVPSGVQGICPAGWHVPSDAEWTLLTMYVKGKSEYRCGDNAENIANALSAPGWPDPLECCAGHNSTTLNKTGFSAVPAGQSYDFGDFGVIFSGFSFDAYFWSATSESNDAYSRTLDSDKTYVLYYPDSPDDKAYGYSVRCLRN